MGEKECGISNANIAELEPDTVHLPDAAHVLAHLTSISSLKLAELRTTLDLEKDFLPLRVCNLPPKQKDEHEEGYLIGC